MLAEYQLEFRSRGSELQVVVRGEERHLDNVVACWLQIAREVAQRQPVRLLVVSHVVGEPMSAELMPALFAKMAGRGFEGLRIAYVDAQGFKTPLMETAEILASEQGFGVRVFDSLTAAEVWLRHGAD
jgi:hypothetical protein